jgi:hypothetical protein
MSESLPKGFIRENTDSPSLGTGFKKIRKGTGRGSSRRLFDAVSVASGRILIGDELMRLIGAPRRIDFFYSQEAGVLAISPGAGRDARVIRKVRGGGRCYFVTCSPRFKRKYRVPGVVKDGTIFVEGIDYDDGDYPDGGLPK